MLYFRQDDWETLCKPLLKNLRVSGLERISKASSLFYRLSGTGVITPLKAARDAKTSIKSPAGILLHPASPEGLGSPTCCKFESKLKVESKSFECYPFSGGGILIGHKLDREGYWRKCHD